MGELEERARRLLREGKISVTQYALIMAALEEARVGGFLGGAGDWRGVLPPGVSRLLEQQSRY